MPKLFISHSSSDDKGADQFAAIMQAHAIPFWLDHSGGLHAGMTDWEESIRAAIKECSAGVLIMSPRSLQSKTCKAEVNLLRELNKPVYVASLEHCDPADIWLLISMDQRQNLHTDFEAGATAIAAVINGETLPNAPTPVQARLTGADTMRVNLPYLNTVPLTGRDTDLTAIRAMLGAHVTQIIAVGGTGKSRIAAEIALNHPNGMIWHRCSESSGAFEVTDLIRAHYALDEKAKDEQVLAKLDSQPPLIIIDNAEDVGKARADYVALLNRIAAHNVPMLLTSRAAWHELKPRREHPLDPINLDEAERVTLYFASAEGLKLTDADARVLAKASLLHPRLIEFSVSQLHERSFAEVLKQLQELKHEDVQDALSEMIVKTVAQMSETGYKGGNA